MAWYDKLKDVKRGLPSIIYKSNEKKIKSKQHGF